MSWCNPHYHRQLRGKDMDAPIRTWASRPEPPQICSHEGCGKGHYSSGLCQFHYHRRYQGRDLDEPRKRHPAVAGVTKRKTKAGYVHVWLPGHPNAFGTGWVTEHRYVMEQAIGRPLLDEETVHHKNGVRDDNRLENLELWGGMHPAGQRVEDLVVEARRILGLYGDDDERARYAT